MASRKRVRIVETPTMTVAGSDFLSDEERGEAWWSMQDLMKVKDSVKQQCRSHRQHRRYSDCLAEAYQSACSRVDRINQQCQVLRDDPDLRVQHGDGSGESWTPSEVGWYHMSGAVAGCCLSLLLIQLRHTQSLIDHILRACFDGFRMTDFEA
jgi:hypothetical protein